MVIVSKLINFTCKADFVNEALVELQKDDNNYHRIMRETLVVHEELKKKGLSSLISIN